MSVAFGARVRHCRPIRMLEVSVLLFRFALEHEQIVSTVYSYDIVLYLVGFVAVTMSLYVLYSYALTKMNAAALNLNLLCTDFYALLAGMLIFHNTVHPLTYLAFFLIIVGVVIYYTRPTKVKVKPHKLPTVSEKVEAAELSTDVEKNYLASSSSDASSIAPDDAIELTQVLVLSSSSPDVDSGRPVPIEPLSSSARSLRGEAEDDPALEAAGGGGGGRVRAAAGDIDGESGLGADEECVDAESKVAMLRAAEVDNDSDCVSSSLDSRSSRMLAVASEADDGGEAPESEPLLVRPPSRASPATAAADAAVVRP